MSCLDTFLPAWKAKKYAILDQRLFDAYNHPHRLGKIELRGKLDYTIDEREFTSPGTSADVYVFDLDFSQAADYTRILEENYPWGGAPAPTAPVAGEFVFYHIPWAPWTASIERVDTSAVAIGTVTVREYSRATTSDPWDLDATTTTDIDYRFTAVPSGGSYDGGGTVIFNSYFSGTHSTLLPSLNKSFAKDITDDSWQPESSYFATTFSDFLDTNNTADGGGHSGSISMTLHFTNLTAPKADFSDSANSQLEPTI